MKCLLLIAVLTALPALGRADEAVWNNLFREAQNAYDAGRFEQAVTCYEQLEQQGQDRAIILFNKGNALYRLGRIGPAVAAYRRALYERPRDPDLRANLHLVQQQVGALSAEQGMWERGFGQLSQREWSRLGTFAYWLGGGLGALYWLVFPRRSLKRAALAALAAVLLAAAGYWHWHQLRQHPEAIIVQANVQALFAPMPGALVHFPLPEGSLVSVRETSGAWRKIAVGQQEGWIPAATCVPLSLPN